VRHLFFALALVALSGCSSTHDAITATPGVYDLTIASERDACSPMRSTGPMGTAGITSLGTVLTVTAPDLVTNAPMLVPLSGEAGYADATTQALAPCTNATLVRSYTVVSAAGGSVDVAYHESWSGLASCGAAMRLVMPAAPSADCDADLVLRYRLRAECASPCQILLSADGTTSCRC